MRRLLAILRRRTTTGFTLLEVAVASALTGLMMVMVLAWVGQLARTGALGGDQQNVERDVQWVAANLAQDTYASITCDPNKQGNSLAALGPAQMTLFLDDNQDGLADKVTWSISDNKVLRSVQIATKACTFPNPASDVVMSELLRSGTTSLFAPVSDGAEQTKLSGIVDCTAAANACPWQGAAVKAVFANSTNTALAVLDEVVRWGVNPSLTGSVPGSPVNVTAVASDQTVTLSWLAPTQVGLSPVSGYEVTVLGADGVSAPTGVIGATTRSASTTALAFTGLTNGVPYVFKVTAKNQSGGSVSAPGVTATPALSLTDADWAVRVAAMQSGAQTMTNLGKGGSALDAQLGASSSADSADPLLLENAGTTYAYVPAAAGNYLQAPDASNLDITGDVDLRVRVQPDSWAATSTTALMGKWGAGSDKSYAMALSPSGGAQKITLSLSANGTASTTATSSATLPGFASGVPVWVRSTWKQSNGRVQFFWSLDGTNWTAVGSDQTAAIGSLKAGAAPLTVGTTTGSDTMGAKVFEAKVFNGIDGTAVAALDTSVCSQAVCSGKAGETWTVVRSGTELAAKTVIVDRDVLLCDGTDYLKVPDNSLLDFTSAQDFTVVALFRMTGSPSGASILSKKQDGGTGAGWRLMADTTSGGRRFFNVGGSSQSLLSAVTGQSFTNSTETLAGVRSSGAATVVANTTTGSAVTLASDLSNTLSMYVGRSEGGNYAAMEFIGAAVFRRALNSAEIAQVAAALQ